MLKSIKSKNKYKGSLGEKITSKYLDKIECEIIARNFKCFYGEIDIIFKDKDEIVFAEVKSRVGIKYGFPAESVTCFKKKHIVNTARFFLYKMGLTIEKIRFDVIEVYFRKQQKPLINHIKNVFW